MKIFIDTANINEIRDASEWGIIDGVTTNPTLISKEKNNFKNIIKDIINIVNGPISVEVISTDTEGIVKEAIEMSKWSQNIVIKVPMNPDGLKATKILNAQGIETNVTLIFSVNQALLASKAGAKYISIFIGRLDDIGHDGIQILSDTIKIFNLYNIKTQVISASIRHPMHVVESAKVGTHAVTIPFNVLEKMFRHPLTDIGIDRFLKDWMMIKNG